MTGKLPVLLVAWVVCSAPLPASSPGTSLPEPDEVVEELLAPYRQLSSLHLRARYAAAFWIEGLSAPLTTGEISSEYWASPIGFRIESDVDKELTDAGFLSSQVQTYDGIDSRILWVSDKTLVVQPGEFPQVSMVANPVFLALGFLRLASADCVVCRPTLANIRNTLPGETHLPPGTVIEPVPGDSEALLIRIPREAKRDLREITLTRRDGSWFVEEILHRGISGELTARYQFTNPMEVKGAPSGFAPARGISIETWVSKDTYPNGATQMKISGEIASLDLDPDFPLGTLSIATNTRLADTVID